MERCGEVGRGEELDMFSRLIPMVFHPLSQGRPIHSRGFPYFHKASYPLRLKILSPMSYRKVTLGC